eukprot:5573247-Pyramimonas_sp.AAC.1
MFRDACGRSHWELWWSSLWGHEALYWACGTHADGGIGAFVRVMPPPSLIMFQKDVICCAPQRLARLERKVSVMRSETSRRYRRPFWALGW